MVEAPEEANVIRMSVNPDDVFTITLATDLHLGCHEKDGIRFEDSFVTFEEILDFSVKKDVDFVLLAGDLFHDNKPTAACLKKSLELLRKYCMGDKPIAVEFLSDEVENFKNCPIPRVNYQDPNYNISIPVYSIHGNHDDPTGFGRTSALDILSASGLVNYVGKWVDLTQVTLKPILLRKGKTQVAIYGLSHIRDERLNRLLKANLVHFERPPNKDAWFNILLLHQNRVRRQLVATNVIEESMLPDFFDLVIWGHEHECRIEPEWNDVQKFYVTQPGSSVATSLCDAEAVEKKIGLLTINQKEFKIEPFKLETVRPFVFDTASITDWKPDDVKWDSKKFQAYTEKYIRSRLLLLAQEQLTGHSKQPKLPLIRLRLDYEDDEQVFNQIRCSQLFSDHVANPADVVVLRKLPPAKRASRKDNKLYSATLPKTEPTSLTIEDLVKHFFTSDKENESREDKLKRLDVLNVVSMGEGVKQFVEKDDKDALLGLIKVQMNRSVKYLKESQVLPSSDAIDAALKQFQENSTTKPEDEIEEVRKLLESDRSSISNTFGSTTNVSAMTVINSSDEEFSAPVELNAAPKTTRGRGRGRGRGAKTPAAPRGKRAAKTSPSTAKTGNRSISDFLNRTNSSSSTVVHAMSDDDDDDPFTKRTPRKKVRLNYADE